MCGRPATAAGGSITALIVNYMLGGGHCLPAGRRAREGKGAVTSSPVLPAAAHPEGQVEGLPLQKCVPPKSWALQVKVTCNWQACCVVRALAEIRDRRLEERMCPEGRAGWVEQHWHAESSPGVSGTQAVPSLSTDGLRQGSSSRAPSGSRRCTFWLTVQTHCGKGSDRLGSPLRSPGKGI